MIELPRYLARNFRAVLRKSVLLHEPRTAVAGITLATGADGFTIRARQADIAVEHRLGGNFAADQLVVPSNAFADFEGTDALPVRLERSPKGVTARWQERGLPRCQEYEWAAKDKPPDWPPTPQQWATLPPEFLQALDDAMQTASRESVRYATHRVQFRGGTGQLIATDGKQLLIQSEFNFPFQEDLLVSRIMAFGCHAVPPDKPVQIGRTNKFLTVQSGFWTFHLAIDAQARFPRAEEVIPKTKPVTVFQVAPAERDFLLQVLPKLPGEKDDNAPVTLALNGHAVVRAKADGQSRTTEVVLEKSHVSGKALRFATCRAYVSRALQLGFGELAVVSPDTPILCRDQSRLYLWMPLGEKSALKPAANALRITPPVNGEHPSAVPTSPRKRAMSTNGRNDHPTAVRPPPPVPPATNGSPPSPLSLVEEAEALQNLLREALARTTRLVAGLKQQKKQQRLVSSTLASLRQLQQVQGQP
ncbi:MAG: hypothetical protein JNM56_26050 [Planctomycetia bacterium]|nr:hypothetical protein [Planctomycetia bacterium]